MRVHPIRSVSQLTRMMTAGASACASHQEVVDLYKWLVFLHLVGVFGFLLAHGASAVVSFRVRAERDVHAIRALLNLSSSALLAASISLLLLIGGVGAGFVGHWWSYGWIWTALGVFIVLWGVMSAFSGRALRRVRLAVGITGPGAVKEPGPPEEIAAALAAANPWTGMLMGSVGLLIILWLMMFKPF